MTTLTDTQVVTASGGLVELGYQEFSYTGNVTATSGSPLVVMSPLTVVCDGGPILIEAHFAGLRPALTAGTAIVAELYEDGSLIKGQFALVITPANGDVHSPITCQYRRTPSTGSHTYQIKVYVSSGSGYLSNNDSGLRLPSFLRVSKIVQATQWPAVTTGTIICTSTTRPASPFEGQRIYETDTNKEWVYDGAAWYTPGAYVVDVAATSTFTIASGAGAGLVDITGVTQSASLVSGRRYSASLHVPQVAGTTGDRFSVKIVAGGSIIQASYGGIVSNGVPVCLWGTFTGSGTTTIKAQCARDVGSGTTYFYADGQSPIRLTVIDIGPA